jgi:hypothetical protein
LYTGVPTHPRVRLSSDLFCLAHSITMQNDGNYCPKAMLLQAMDSIKHCITTLRTVLPRHIFNLYLQRIDSDLSI